MANKTSFKKGHKQSNTGRTHFKKGFVPWNKGIKYTEEQKAKLDLSGLKVPQKGHCKGRQAWNKGKSNVWFLGEKSKWWKGDDVGYFSLHCWVRRHLGTPNKCEHCGDESLKRRQYHWANVSREYKRDLDDWIRLCVKCHKEYDRVQ
jgi:hypothetical protein